MKKRKLKPYMAYSRSEGQQEGSLLVIDYSVKDAKKRVWPHASWGIVDEYIDLAVHLGNDYLLFLSDKSKLDSGEPHVVDCAVSCVSCDLWGTELDNRGICLECYRYAGAELAKLWGCDLAAEPDCYNHCFRCLSKKIDVYIYKGPYRYHGSCLDCAIEHG